MVAYHTLAHRAANVKRHGRGDAAGSFVLNDYSAYLRTVAVGHDYLIALFHNVGYVLAGLFHYLKLRLSRCRLSGFLQCVTAKSYN